MSRKFVLPSHLSLALDRIGFREAKIHLSVPTDISLRGKKAEQWLIVLSNADSPASLEALVVGLDDPESPCVFFRFPFTEILAFRSQPAVGSALIQILRDGVWVDVIRHSNRLCQRFDGVVRKLESLRHLQADVDSSPMVTTEEADPRRCPKCELMLEFPGELCPRCLDHAKAFLRVLQIVRPYWKSAATLVVLLLFGIVLDMAWPMLTRYLVDFVLSDPAPLDAHPVRFLAGMTPNDALLLVVGALAGVHLTRAAVNVVTGKISARVGNVVTFDVRARLVQKLQRLGLSYYSRQETGSLVGRVAYDTEAVQSFINQVTSGFLMQLLLVVFSFAMMFSLEPSLALWTLVPAPFVLGGAFIYWRYVHPHYQRFWDRSSKQAGLLNGILSGIRVVKAFAQEHTEYDRFQGVSSRVRQSKDQVDQTAAHFYPIMGLVFQVGGWVIWYVGGTSVLSDHITLGTLMAFFGYLSMFYGPLGNLTNLTTWLTQFSTQMHRIFEVLDTPEVIPEIRDPVTLTRARGQIEFRDVSFGYTRGAPVLKNITFQINPGERIGIVGRSGSGKTSLINLISRFYDVDSGALLLDGEDVRTLAIQDLRSQVAMVLQEPFLFRGSLAENIKYGRPEASMDEVIEASRAANAHDFIMRQMLAYDTSVGERGSELSGGERQRVSVARALVCHSRILILDEATSAVDSESEQAIQRALDEAAGKRTTILIAHRLSTLQNCDRIFVLEQGGIVESGSHSELMRQEGLYARWVRIQQGKTSGSPSVHSHRQGLPSLQIPWLRPGVDQFQIGAHGELQLQIHGAALYRGVHAMRCLPIQAPDSYISLQANLGGRDVEVGMIRDLSAWSEQQRQKVMDALGRRYLFQQVERINGIRKFGNFLEFSAKTELGRTDFVIRYREDSIQNFGDIGRLMTDIEGNHYLIQDLNALPDRHLFNRYIYW